MSLYYRLLDGDNWEDLAENLEVAAENGKGFYYNLDVVLDGTTLLVYDAHTDRLVGFVTLERDGSAICLIEIFKRARGNGHGRQVVHDVDQYMNATGFKFPRISVLNQSVEFFEKCGYNIEDAPRNSFSECIYMKRTVELPEIDLRPETSVYSCFQQLNARHFTRTMYLKPLSVILRHGAAPSFNGEDTSKKVAAAILSFAATTRANDKPLLDKCLKLHQLLQADVTHINHPDEQAKKRRDIARGIRKEAIAGYDEFTELVDELLKIYSPPAEADPIPS